MTDTKNTQNPNLSPKDTRQSDARAERLAMQLRENLRRRKAQSRGLKEDGENG
jgi:hypothetical protein